MCCILYVLENENPKGSLNLQDIASLDLTDKVYECRKESLDILQADTHSTIKSGFFIHCPNNYVPL